MLNLHLHVDRIMRGKHCTQEFTRQSQLSNLHVRRYSKMIIIEPFKRPWQLKVRIYHRLGRSEEDRLRRRTTSVNDCVFVFGSLQVSTYRPRKLLRAGESLWEKERSQLKSGTPNNIQMCRCYHPN